VADLPLCIFCRQPITTKSDEHIFPQWLQEYLAIKCDSPNIEREGTPDQSVENFNSHVMREVCNTCNNDWMGQLETKAKSRVKRLLEDVTPHQLIVGDGVLLRWILKTAFTLHASIPREKRIIPPEVFPLLIKDKKPRVPAHTIVAIARIDGDPPSLEWRQNQGWPIAFNGLTDSIKDELLKVCHISFRLRGFAAQVTYSPINLPNTFLHEYREDCIQYLSPVSKRYDRKHPIMWPPTCSLATLVDLDESVVLMARPQSRLLEDP
jgi:hypothetical protein